MQLKKSGVLLIMILSFLFSGCQTKANQTAQKNTQEGKSIKFNFFSFKKGGSSVQTGINGKNVGQIDKFLDIDLGTNLKNVKLAEGITLPIMVKGEYYVYKVPQVISSIFKAGTSISGDRATITIAKGGSTDLNLNGLKRGIQVDLANLVSDGNSWKVIPTPIVEEIGSLKVNSKDSLLNRKLILYFCYPVYNELEFSLKVPPKNDLNPRSGSNLIADIKGNDGEIKFNIKGNGYGTSQGKFIVQLVITPQLNNVKVGEDGEIMLAHEKMNECGSPVDPYKRYKYPIYLELEPENNNNNVDIKCNNENNNIYDMRVSQSGIYCKITINMEDVEKIVYLKLKTAYTLVKKEEVDNIGIIIDRLQ